MIHVALVRRPIDLGALVTAVAAPGVGAIATFLGTVRDHNDGRAVTGIDYSAYDAMAERELRAIGTEVVERFAVASIAIEHRLGTLAVGDASVAVVVAAERRAPALDAQRWAIEELKRRVPIWKREAYVDGERAWVDPTASATGAAAMARAEPA